MGSTTDGGATRAPRRQPDHADDDRDGPTPRDPGPVARRRTPTWLRRPRRSPSRVAPRHGHRLRDLDRGGRRWAAAIALALLLAPLVGYARFAADWVPAGDPALMGLRVLDVGTTRTPLLGQPSASGAYAETVSPVHHPGALHFYLMALPVRAFGGTVGMPLVSVFIGATCLLTAAWAFFRQLGRAGGLVAAVVLSVVAFTTGASSFVNPISSSIAGYPLLLSVVLLWCVMCGDVRVIPAAVAAVSFTAQAHLSVVAATVVATAVAGALAALWWWRDGRGRDPAARRELARWSLGGAAVGAVLWAPVLAQQVFGDNGNLSHMVWFARHGNREQLGYGSAVRQLVHAVGLPPLLGRTDLDGRMLLAEPRPVEWATACLVGALVLALGLRWRASSPARARLCVLAGVVAAAGMVNGASVPYGIEMQRLSFYHWTYILAMVVAVVLGLGAVDLARALGGDRLTRAPVPAVVAAVCVAVIAVPSVAGTGIDRRTNTHRAATASWVERDQIDAVADAVLDHRDEMGEHPALVVRGEPMYSGVSPGITYALIDRGLDVGSRSGYRFFVADERLATADELDSGLVLLYDADVPRPPLEVGELVADVWLGDDPRPDFEVQEDLVSATAGADVVVGAEAEAALAAIPDPIYRAVLRRLIDQLRTDPTAALQQRALLEFLRDTPLASPRFPADQIARALSTAAVETSRPGLPNRVRVYLLDRDEMLAFVQRGEVVGAG